MKYHAIGGYLTFMYLQSIIPIQWSQGWSIISATNFLL